jgi:hypothetical protein
MLSGMLHCSVCGTGLVGQKMSGRWRYYSCRGLAATANRPRICSSRRSRQELLDDRVWSAVSRAVSSPDFIYDRLTALQAAPLPANNDGAELRAKVRSLGAEERGLLDAIRKAPSAAAIISVDLEKVASQRKALERELKALDTANGNQGGVTVTKADVDAFRQTVKPYLKAMDVEQKRELLSLLAFEATVADNGEVKASIAVPHEQIVFTTGRTSA